MRFRRQIMIPQIGDEGQEKLGRAKVTVVGTGGLGNPVLTYLACAGVGELRAVDGELVEESNLNRQFLHGARDIGRSKAEGACRFLKRIYPDVRFVPVRERLTAENAAAVLGRPDVLLDCVDNIRTRRIVNSYALSSRIPLVEGGVSGFSGFVMDVHNESVCLDCLLPPISPKESETPIIGTAAGVIGSLQAAECIKILLGIGEPLFGKMLQYNGLRASFEITDLHIDANCRQPHASAQAD